MRTNEAKNCTQTLPYLRALLIHTTPSHKPKNNKKDTQPTQKTKKCLHKHEHKYAQHNSSTNNNQQVSHCINKPAGLALLQQTSRSRTASTNQYVSHCIHRSRGKPENVSTNTQNGPKSKQRFDLLHKHKQKYTQYTPSTKNNLPTCPALLQKDCTPCETSTSKRISRRDSEKEPTNPQNKPKTNQSSDLTLKNRFTVLQEPTMSA
jgi:hypothetical protein